MTRLFILLCILTLGTAVRAGADEVRLQNGDRLTGQVVSLAGGILTFDTGHGQLKIPWTDVTALTIEQPLLVTVGATPAVSATLTATADGIMLQPGGLVALADIVALGHPPPPPSTTIDGGANIGILAATGNTDVNSFHLDGDLAVRAAANRYTGWVAVNRAANRGDETAESWTVSGSYARFLTPRLFLSTDAIFTHDKFRSLDLRSAYGAGIGYQVLDTARVKLTLDAGIGYVNQNFDASPDDSYTAARESATFDVFVVPSHVQLFHNHDSYFAVTGGNNLFFRTRTGVWIGLVAGFVTTAQLDMDYDKSPAPGRRTTDRTFALTLGYRF